jgi:hypothetical protein
MTSIALLLQTDTGTAADAGGLLAMGGALTIALLVLVVIFVVALWKVFAKAGQPGWASLIPIYNAYVLLKVAGKPGWWLILLCIPFVNIVVLFMVSIAVAKAFGRSTAFGVVMLVLLCGIGYLILGFGKSQYLGLKASAVA